MTSRLTINIDNDVKRKLQILARSKQLSVSSTIKELIIEEYRKTDVKASETSLGTYLANLLLTEIPDYKNDKEKLGKLKDEKHLNG